MKYSRIRSATLFALLALCLFFFSNRKDSPISPPGNKATPLEIAPAPLLQSTSLANERVSAHALTTVIPQQAAPNVSSDSDREISEALAVTESFRQWLRAQTDLSDPAVRQEGQARLQARRSSMVTLIRKAPEEALAQALSYAEREYLPEEWQPLLEERFSTIASLAILPDCSHSTKGDSSQIILERPGQPTLQGETWGQMNAFQSKNKIPVEGIALDNWTALSDNAVQPISGLELDAVERQFPMAPSAQNLKPGVASYAALIGGQVNRFASYDDRQEMVALFNEIAKLPGPNTAAPLIEALSDDNSVSFEYVSQAAMAEASTWTETPKSVLVINTVFPDKNTPVGTQAEWQAVMSEVSDWLSDNSYGKTNLVVTVPPTVFEFPSHSTSYEVSNLNVLKDPAWAWALEAGYDPANYDITIVAFPHIDHPFGGSATVGGDSQWLNGTRSANVIAHEFGHNYGLLHASSWDVDDGSIMPASGAPDTADPRHVTYGDRFSVMGVASSFPDGYFSPQALSQLNWMDASRVETVSAPGVYRVYRFDHSAAESNPLLALKLQRESSQTFWLGYRQNFTSNAYMSHGAYLIWEYTSDWCRLLDMTPDSQTSSSQADKQDAALALGQTFADPTDSLYITPIAKGGTAPNEWLDVQVEFSVAGNDSPTASILPPSGEVVARSPVTLEATATDPNGDPLIYVWDLGEGQTATGSQVVRTFEAGGSIDISLRVADGKGGFVDVTRQIQVSDPLTEIEELNLPVTTTLYDGIQYRGLHVSSSSNYSMTSPDGTTWHQVSNSLGFIPNGFATGSDRVVAVGGYYDSVSSTTKPKTAVSIDGTQWVTQLPEGTGNLNAVAYHDGTFVAVGDEGLILSSTDGVTWQARSGTTKNLSNITETSNGWVACGQDATILTSPDGISWTQQSTPSTGFWLHGIAADALEVACVGPGEDYWWSEDGGINWETRSFGLLGFNPTMISQGENLWLAAANTWNNGARELKLAVSSDGLRWAVLPSIPVTSFNNNIRLVDGRLWIYGVTGKVLRSSLLYRSNNAPTLSVNWPAALTVGSDVNLSATVDDADSDSIDVGWNLNNNQSYQFGPTVHYTPIATGPVTLTAWASDGRGGYTASSQSYLIDDHGNTMESATNYATSTNILGEIVSVADSDWFSLHLNAPGTLTVWTTGILNTIGELHNASGSLAINDDFEGSENFQIEETLLPGQYWIKVDGHSTSTGNYHLYNTFAPIGSAFTITSMETINEGSDWQLVVGTAIGYQYQVQVSNSLMEDWTPVGGWISATSEETTLTVPLPDPRPTQNFYRISIQAP